MNADGVSGLGFRDEKTLTQIIYYDPRPGWYYMGDNEGDEYEHSFPNASFSAQYEDGVGSNGIIEADKLLDKANIKLISWDYTNRKVSLDRNLR